MPPKADRPIRKVTLNLYVDDCIELEHRYGRGWTEKVRNLVDAYVRNRRASIFEDYTLEFGDHGEPHAD